MGKFVGTSPSGALGLALLLCLGAAGCEGKQGAPGPAGSSQPGPQGDPGPPGGTAGEPSISGISPSTVYVGHDVDVTLSGFATQWADGVALDFGPGITATPIAVSSPTSILAHLVIAPDATPDAGRDVKVGNLTLSKALHLEVPLSVTIIPKWGPACTDTSCDPISQGSIVAVEAIEHDVATPFSFQPSALVTRGGVSGATTLSAAGGFIQSQTPYAYPFFMLVDFDAPVGDYDVEVKSTLVAGATRSTASKALSVVARTPIALTAPTTGHVTTSRESIAYSYQGASTEWVRTAVTGPPLATPTLVVVPKSGAFADRIAPAGPQDLGIFRSPIHFLSHPAEPHYLTVWDPSGERDYDFNLDVRTSPATNSNGTPATQIDAIESQGASGWYHLDAQQGQHLTLAVGDGPVSVCGVDFAAAITVLREADGHTLLTADTVCPGTAAPCMQGLCPVPPLDVAIPSDGGYIVKVSGSPTFCPQCTFDYGVRIGISP